MGKAGETDAEVLWEEVTRGKALDHLRGLIEGERYLVGVHASERLEERGILEWQIIAAVEDAALLLERPSDLPNPAVEVIIELPDGTEVKAVWSHLASTDLAKLVTVHFFDED